METIILTQAKAKNTHCTRFKIIAIYFLVAISFLNSVVQKGTIVITGLSTLRRTLRDTKKFMQSKGARTVESTILVRKSLNYTSTNTRENTHQAMYWPKSFITSLGWGGASITSLGGGWQSNNSWGRRHHNKSIGAGV